MFKFFITSLIITTSVPSFAQSKKQTVGDLLKKAKDASRGGQLQQMQKSETAVPDSKLVFMQQQQSVDLKSVKPPKSTEILGNVKRSNGEAEYERTLDRQIQELYKLTQKFSNNPARGELWLRLAELYVEKASLVDSRKQDLYDQQLKSYQDGKTKVKPQLDTKEAKDYNKKAIQLYEWFVKDFPKDEKMPQALFFLGYNNFEIGDNQKGLSYYNQLVNNYPNSQYIPESHFALGEYYFENEKWSEAYKSYSYLIKKPKHRLHTFAMYKSAWSLFRLGKTEDAVKYMDYIIKNKGGSGSEGSGKVVNKNRLESEASRDMVVFFADIGDPQRAINYFGNLSESTQANALEKLAYFYSDKGNREDARVIFDHLIKINPNSKKAFEYQYQIVQNYFYAKNSPQFKEELYKWINTYRKDSNWYEYNKTDKVFVDNAVKLQEQTLRNYVLQQHQTAQNSRASFSQQSALEGYKLYFEEFPDAAQVADMHFFYAELLYDMKKYEEAATHYTWVVENAPTSKFSSKAGQNILLAIEKALPKDEDMQKRVGDSIEPIDLDPRVEKFIKTSEWYVKKFPNTEKEAEIRFRVGRLYYQTNHFDEAEAIFRDIVKKYPRTKYSEYSANLLLDIYNLKKDYTGLEKVGKELLSDSALAGTKAGNDIRNVLEKANFKKAQDLELSKDYAKSAEQFENFAVQNPSSDLVTMALFNAGVNYERSGDLNKAVKNYSKVIQSKDPKSEGLKVKSKKLLAKVYQSSGRLEESAQLFEQMAAENPKDSLVPNYHYNAAVMYEALGYTNKAVKNYSEFLSLSKSNKDKADVYFSLAEMNRKIGNKSKAEENYEQFVQMSSDSAKKVEALSNLMALSRKKDESEKYRAKVLAMHNRLSANEKAKSAPFAAKIKYDDSVKTYEEFRQIKIPADPKKQKAAVDKKLEMINKLNAELAQVVKFDSAEEIIKSLNLTGEANAHMADSILSAPVPAELKEEQKKIYLEGISKIADPFKTKAIDSFKLTVERGHDLAVYNDSYKNALSRMKGYMPETYYDNGEIASESRLMNWLGE